MGTGIVIGINKKRGYILIQINEGDFVVFELLSGIDIAVGDRIGGNLDGLGGETLIHLSQKEKFDAFGQTGPSSFAACERIFYS